MDYIMKHSLDGSNEDAFKRAEEILTKEFDLTKEEIEQIVNENNE